MPLSQWKKAVDKQVGLPLHQQSYVVIYIFYKFECVYLTMFVIIIFVILS